MSTPLAPTVRARRRLMDERGATAVEYGLMIALIAVVILSSVTALGLGISGGFGEVSDAVEAAGVGNVNQGGGNGNQGGGNGQGNQGVGNGNGGPASAMP